MVLSGRSSRRFLLAAAVVGSGALVAGCGGSSHNGGSDKTVSFVKAADLSSSAAGYKIDMTMHETVAGQTVDATGTGAFDSASHEATLTMNMSIAGQTLQLPMVLANGTMYMKFPASIASKIPGDKPWVSMTLNELGNKANLPGLGSLSNSSSTLTNPGEYLQFLRAAASGSVKDLGQQMINGVQTTHYQAELDFSKMPSGLPAADRAAAQQLVSALEKRAEVPNIPADVWIDGSDLVRRIRMTIDETVGGKAVSVAITEDFTDYGAQPAPTIPAAGDTTDLLSLLKQSGG